MLCVVVVERQPDEHIIVDGPRETFKHHDELPPPSLPNLPHKKNKQTAHVSFFTNTFMYHMVQ